MPKSRSTIPRRPKPSTLGRVLGSYKLQHPEVILWGGFDRRLESVWSCDGGGRLMWWAADGTPVDHLATGGNGRADDRSIVVYAAALSADGRRFLMLWSDDTVDCWDVVQRKVRWRRKLDVCGGSACFHLAISDQGSRALVAVEPTADRGSTTLFDIDRGVVLRHLNRGSGPVGFLPGGPPITSGPHGISIWNESFTRVAHRIPTPAPLALCAADQNQLIVASADGVRRYDVDSRSVAWCANARRSWARIGLAVTARDVWVYHLEGSGCRLRRHARSSGRLELRAPVQAWSLISAEREVVLSHEGSLHIYQRHPFREVSRHHGHVGEVTTLAVTRDGSRLVSGGSDGTVRLWNARGADTILARTVGPVERVLLSSDERDVLVAPWGGGPGYWAPLRAWNLATRRERRPWTNLGQAVKIFAIALDEHAVVAAALEQPATRSGVVTAVFGLFDLRRRRWRWRIPLPWPRDDCHFAAVSGDGSLLHGAHNGDVSLRTSDGEDAGSVAVPRGVTMVHVLAGGAYAVGVRLRRGRSEVVSWKVRTGDALRVLIRADASTTVYPREVASATHGSLAAVACRGTVVLWNRHTGEPRETIDLATGADLPTALAWNGDGSQLFVGTARGVILCFDVPRP